MVQECIYPLPYSGQVHLGKAWLGLALLHRYLWVCMCGQTHLVFSQLIYWVRIAEPVVELH